METVRESLKFDKDKYINILKPSKCPHCNKGVSAIVINWFFHESRYNNILIAFMECPLCGETFACYYSFGSFVEAINYPYPAYPFRTIGGGAIKEDFSAEINSISPSFVKIYNQAYQAEQEELDEIYGIGYRKAFEFLIKDYALYMKPEDEKTIKKMSLSQCIDFIFSENEKKIVDITSWIGNDQTHYENKHDEFDISDFKKMISICISKIETSVREREYLKSFEKKK